ncbi:hypothetical protein [Burkholderia pyrrocinia]|uniref:hypothetical protein n=1 Tax=Burkholderia pyrrocinia TaxID=60550 RepID=UPI00158D5468|nr:hypothetical protein [Burkholderia pyrrocinia]
MSLRFFTFERLDGWVCSAVCAEYEWHVKNRESFPRHVQTIMHWTSPYLIFFSMWGDWLQTVPIAAEINVYKLSGDIESMPEGVCSKERGEIYVEQVSVNPSFTSATLTALPYEDVNYLIYYVEGNWDGDFSGRGDSAKYVFGRRAKPDDLHERLGGFSTDSSDLASESDDFKNYVSNCFEDIDIQFVRHSLYWRVANFKEAKEIFLVDNNGSTVLCRAINLRNT